MTNPILTTHQLSKTFSTAGVQKHVLRNLDMEIRAGDYTVVMGASGSGKSTLLYALSGMDRPTLGDVTFAGQHLASMSESALARFRRNHCGFVFQQVYLLDTMSIMDNVLAAGLLVSNDRKALAARAAELFDQVKVADDTRTKFPAQVSGGEAQRAGVVRALINSPTVLFADEPTGSLDQTSGTAVLDVLTDVHTSGQTVVMVTHDLKSARRGERVLYLRDGAIVGDLDLGPFTSDDDTDRNDTLRGFLVEMGW
ncbi:MAG: ABC transporter ATP-binding protein [Micrococcales bacterium]|nr:ABC transporter ATP-binding protein [Micrococcales bacterium]MCL2667423.1 ABC transporter ATP-binding protein [Micrococcales bacterium]